MGNSEFSHRCSQFSAASPSVSRGGSGFKPKAFSLAGKSRYLDYNVTMLSS